MNNSSINNLKELNYKISNKFNSLVSDDINNNIVNHFLKIVSAHNTSILSFLSVYNELNIQLDNNKQYVHKNDFHHHDINQLSFCISTVNSRLICLMSMLKQIDIDRDNLLNQFLSQFKKQKSHIFLEDEIYFCNYSQGQKLLEKNFQNNNEYISYIKEHFILENKQLKYMNILNIIKNQKDDDILSTILDYTNEKILPLNFLEKNYTSEYSILHILSERKKHNVAYELVKKYNFPIQSNCNFLSDIKDVKYIFKFISDFKIDLYNSQNEFTIKEENETISPYEAIVKSNNPYKNEILNFASKQSNIDEKSLKICAAQEFAIFVKKKKKKGDIIEYLSKSKIDFSFLNYFSTYEKQDTSFIDTIKESSFWWLYPLISENKAYNLQDKKGLNFLNAILLQKSPIKYENIFYTNLALLLTKEAIINSNSQFRDIFNEVLNHEGNNFIFFKHPNNKQFLGELGTNKEIEYSSLDNFSPFSINNEYHLSGISYEKNTSLEIIYDFIKKEIPYINEDIIKINKDLQDMCISKDLCKRAKIKQSIFYFYCTHHYSEDNSPLIKYNEINMNSFIDNFSELQNQQNNQKERKIPVLNIISNQALLENIYIVENYFPESLGYQKEKTLLVFEAIFSVLFKHKNKFLEDSKYEFENNEIDLIIEILKIDTEYKILGNKDLFNEMCRFINNPNIQNENSHSYNILKIIFDNSYMNKSILELNKNKTGVLKF